MSTNEKVFILIVVGAGLIMMAFVTMIATTNTTPKQRQKFITRYVEKTGVDYTDLSCSGSRHTLCTAKTPKGQLVRLSCWFGRSPRQHTCKIKGKKKRSNRKSGNRLRIRPSGKVGFGNEHMYVTPSGSLKLGPSF